MIFHLLTTGFHSCRPFCISENYVPNGVDIRGANSFTSVTVIVTVTVAEYTVPSESTVSTASTFDNTKNVKYYNCMLQIYKICVFD